jgi:hypothetical protein
VIALDDGSIGPKLDLPPNVDIDVTVGPPADNLVDNIRGQGNGNAFGVDHGNGPPTTPGPT